MQGPRMHARMDGGYSSSASHTCIQGSVAGMLAGTWLQLREHVKVWCRIYTAGAQGPVLFCLHGCGYTGLTWALVAAAVKDRCAAAADTILELSSAAGQALCVSVRCMQEPQTPGYQLPHLASCMLKVLYNKMPQIEHAYHT